MVLAQHPIEDPDMQAIRETIALRFGIQAMARVVPLYNIKSFSAMTVKQLADFRRGSFSSIPLQDIAIQYQQIMLEIPAIPAPFLFAPGKVLIEEGVDKHSRK